MSTSEFTRDLLEAAATLDEVAAEGEVPEIAGPVSSLTEICTGFGNSWSGSWFGYHSLIYYRDFQSPPAGARFSSEWGFMSTFANETVGDWVEYEYDKVIDAIEARGGKPHLGPAEECAKRARRALDEGRATVVSVLTAALAVREDPLVRETIEQVKVMRPLSQEDVVRLKMPTGSLMTRDMTAMSQGLTAPPHLGYLGHLVAIGGPSRMCGDLGKLARRMAEHLNRTSSSAPVRPGAGGHIFIGHGGSQSWRALKDFLSERLGLEWEEFNRVSPAGIGTITRLESMLDNASMAFLVLTAEDEHADGSEHARENVIHEAGLFQGRLGFQRAIVLLEEGCAEFSNIHGLGQIRFRQGHIEESFEEVRRALEREGLIAPATS
jgi:predicted nucleotide-binding protein